MGAKQSDDDVVKAKDPDTSAQTVNGRRCRKAKTRASEQIWNFGCRPGSGEKEHGLVPGRAMREDVISDPQRPRLKTDAMIERSEDLSEPGGKL